jgi:hypothetical protein
MQDNSLYKLGGICSMLLGVSYMVIGVTTFMMPPALTYGNDAASPFMYFEANKGLLLANYWAFAAVGIVGLAVVPAVSATVLHMNEGWVRWTGTLATLGFAVTILDNYWSIVVTPMRAIAYVRGTAALRAALSVPNSAQFIDLQGWLGYGAVGLWILVCSILALRASLWPKGLAYLGIAVAFAYFLTLGANVVPGWKELILLSSAAAIVLGPIFYIWMGLALRRTGAPMVAQTGKRAEDARLMSAQGE